MTRDDIIRMALKVGFGDHLWLDPRVEHYEDEVICLERFANLVAAAEREACAKVVEAGTGQPIQTRTLEILRQERERIAFAIRERAAQ